MEILKDKRWGMEAVLFLASLVLCVVCGISFLKRDDKENHRLNQIEDSLDQAKDKFSEYDPILSDLSKEVSELKAQMNDLESRKTPPEINLHIKEPISVSIIEKPKIPDPPQISGKKLNGKMGILIKRAGIQRMTERL